MGMFDDIKGKAEQYAKDNPEQLEKISDQAIEHGGDAVDKATGGKFADQVDKGQEFADDKIGE